MDNGFTGINIQQVCSQQEDFYNIMESVIFGIEEDMYTFFGYLRKNWASLNAVMFGKIASSLVTNCLRNIGEYANQIVFDIYDSVTAYIRSNGAPEGGYNIMNYEEVSVWSGYLITYTMDPVNHNGQTGMNIRLVEELLNNELPQIKTNALLKLDSLPASISIFDATGAQQAAYSTRKQAIKDLVEGLLTEIETQIRTNIETEKNNILLAKQQVVQNMNGGSGTTNA